MAKNQKRRSTGGKRRPQNHISWQGSRSGGASGLLAVLLVLGAIACIGGYFLQNSELLSVKADESLVESVVRLNEVMSDNVSALVTEDGEVPDWVEVCNTGAESVEIGKYSLLLGDHFNRMFSFPEYSLNPGETLLIYAEGMDAGNAHGDWSAPFKLAPSGGETLMLLNAQGKVIDAAELPELDADMAYRREDDGSWTIGTATPGAQNHSAPAQQGGIHLESGEIEISEAMADNTLYFADENGEIHDYIEIHNTSGREINLEGWFLSDSSDQLKRWAFPNVTLPAGGYLAVHCSGYERAADANHLHTDFKIGSDGETVYLSRPDGHTVSMAEIPALTADQAYSLADGAWTTELAPTPGMVNDAESAAQVHAAVFGDRSNSIYISEVMASALDQAYDWVEIYNGSGQAVDLSGYGLSDRSDRPRKWQFPQGTAIQPGEYMGVFLSGTERESISGFLNADFALAAAGGYTVTLADPQGNVLDAMYLPPQYTGVAYGRMQNEIGVFYIEQGTPGTANSGAHYRSRASSARTSVEGGLYTSGETFTVELSAPTGSRIYYTLDSSDPTENSTPYTGPIQISGTTILRTRVYGDGCMPSFISTHSYIYDVQNDGSAYVVSLVSDPANLEGSAGILSNYLEVWEREASFELFTADGRRVLGQGCGISLHGQDSRKMPVKTFNVIGRRQYGGTNRFVYPIFRDRDYSQYQSFLMRSSGEDYSMSFMRDTVLSTLMEDTSVLYQEFEVAIVYLNGEYYTLTYLRERMNTYAICQFEGWEGMEDGIDLIKGNSSVKQGSNDTFAQLLDYVKANDMTTQEAYDTLDRNIDIRNYIEYMSLQIFVGNTDTLNVKRYRNAQDDGKWRWVLFDLDWAFFNDTDSIGRWLTPGGTGAGNRTDNTLFIACMQNPTFREQFMTYFGQQMATTFSTENVLKKMQAHYERIDGVLPQYLAAWDIDLDSGLRKLYSYAETRPEKLLTVYFRNAMNLSDAQMEQYFGAALDKIEEYKAKKGE